MPRAQSIYSLLKIEFEVLRQYFKDNEIKEYIRSLKSLARFPILFVFKKNGKLRICVNYKRFNEIIIKNRYILFLIQKMQDRIYKAKYFIRLNFREAYYKIYIKEGEE